MPLLAEAAAPNLRGSRSRGRSINAAVSGKVIRHAMSAGGVVYRKRDGHTEVVLVARPAHGLWALPKGTPEAGESVQQTALREVTEETGLLVEIETEIGAIRYRYGIHSENILVQKVVHHFLMRPIGGDIADHDHEYDVVDWVDIHEAAGRLSYANERNIVEKAAELLVRRRGLADLREAGA